MIGLAILLGAAAAQSPTPAYMLGAGTGSCASAFSPAQQFDTESWIMGFWSGLNIARLSMNGANTDAEGIIGEVRLVCAQHPSKALGLATIEAWKKLANK